MTTSNTNITLTTKELTGGDRMKKKQCKHVIGFYDDDETRVELIDGNTYSVVVFDGDSNFTKFEYCPHCGATLTLDETEVEKIHDVTSDALQRVEPSLPVPASMPTLSSTSLNIDGYFYVLDIEKQSFAIPALPVGRVNHRVELLRDENGDYAVKTGRTDCLPLGRQRCTQHCFTLHGALSDAVEWYASESL